MLNWVADLPKIITKEKRVRKVTDRLMCGTLVVVTEVSVNNFAT